MGVPKYRYTIYSLPPKPHSILSRPLYQVELDDFLAIFDANKANGALGKTVWRLGFGIQGLGSGFMLSGFRFREVLQLLSVGSEVGNAKSTALD